MKNWSFSESSHLHCLNPKVKGRSIFNLRIQTWLLILYSTISYNHTNGWAPEDCATPVNSLFSNPLYSPNLSSK